jgi:hypothetical protein
MILLATERRITAAQIAEKIVRASEETVRRWLKRYLAEGVEGGCAIHRAQAHRAR